MNHRELTLQELHEARRQLDATITFLEQFQAGVSGAVPPPPAPHPTPPPPRWSPGKPAGEDRPSRRPAKPKPSVPQGTTKQGQPPSTTKTTPSTPPPGDVKVPALAALEKPTTLGGAMKLVIRYHPKFTGEQLRAALQADPDYNKLLTQATSGAFGGNLTYWTKQGWLNRSGDQPLSATHQVTATGKEWFSKS